MKSKALLEDWYGNLRSYEDGPQFDPRCIYCAKFARFPKQWKYLVNGFDEVKHVSKATCKTCGEFDPELIDWGG